MEERTYRYHLKNYRERNQKMRCPHCGFRTFVPYVDESGGLLDPSVGRCDREDHCRYHYPPREFFRDHPRLNADAREWRGSPKPVAPARPMETDYIPLEKIPQLANEAMRHVGNNLKTFFVSVFGLQETETTFGKYNICSAKYWRYKGGMSTCFVQIDAEGRGRQVKVMCYDPDTGRRLHSEAVAERWGEKTGSYYTPQRQENKVAFLGKRIIGKPEANLRQCFFGEHLLKKYPGAEVRIVESEKTAMVCDIYMRGENIVWLATGGKNGCRWSDYETYKVLAGRRTVLWPDLGCYEAWSEVAGDMRRHGLDVEVSDFMEKKCTQAEKDQGLDIADKIIEMLMRKIDGSASS